MPTDPHDESGPVVWHPSWDEALQRLEDLLLTCPVDRALPDIDRIVEEAGLPEGFLRGDERARKLLRDAVHARPLSSLDEVARLRTEVELLTLEAGVITERLRDRTHPRDRARLHERLARIGQRLDEVRREL